MDASVMANRKHKAGDLVGSRFGRYLVLSLDTDGSVSHKETRYLCRCDCGTERSVRADSLTRKRSVKSCGCENHEASSVRRTGVYRVSAEDRALTVLIATYKNNCLRTGRSWDLSRDQARELFLSNCYYCGAKPHEQYRFKDALDRVVNTNGIDRIDSSIGYAVGNVRPCCVKCNRAKHAMTETEFYNWLCDAYETFVVKRAKKPAA